MTKELLALALSRMKYMPTAEDAVLIIEKPDFEPVPVPMKLIQSPIKSKNKRARREARGW